jgi:hypothetical protein
MSGGGTGDKSIKVWNVISGNLIKDIKTDS